jgi:hypothetical protein
VTGATSNSAHQRYHGGLRDGGVQINPLCTVGTAERQRSRAVQNEADISRLAEARLITERDIRSDVVRIRNGCAQAADGAIAVGRAAQNGRF